MLVFSYLEMSVLHHLGISDQNTGTWEHGLRWSGNLHRSLYLVSFSGVHGSEKSHRYHRTWEGRGRWKSGGGKGNFFFFLLCRFRVFRGQERYVINHWTPIQCAETRPTEPNILTRANIGTMANMATMAKKRQTR